jgi:hypothetical protein
MTPQEFYNLAIKAKKSPIKQSYITVKLNKNTKNSNVTYIKLSNGLIGKIVNYGKPTVISIKIDDIINWYKKLRKENNDSIRTI